MLLILIEINSDLNSNKLPIVIPELNKFFALNRKLEM